ncbi:hypothetical protein LX32DRAFT_266304 [Colletotrichum zoysiae]|uniref:Uncharacterized protein n=1 Tax=Colletotrichum zoysiae TaxID=1216348 RepID=A0AAD9HPE8_9PEZI|nr:hypothetical protein LX32DRAFT_266304 [Colletotrichum zoysiae]
MTIYRYPHCVIGTSSWRAYLCHMCNIPIHSVIWMRLIVSRLVHGPIALLAEIHHSLVLPPSHATLLTITPLHTTRLPEIGLNVINHTFFRRRSPSYMTKSQCSYLSKKPGATAVMEHWPQEIGRYRACLDSAAALLCLLKRIYWKDLVVSSFRAGFNLRPPCTRHKRPHLPPA